MVVRSSHPVLGSFGLTGWYARNIDVAENQILETASPCPNGSGAARRAWRTVLTILRVRRPVIGGRRELFLIRTSPHSAFGARPQPFALAQRVVVELKTNQQIEGEVEWVRGADAASVSNQVDISSLLANPTVLEKGVARLPRVEALAGDPCASARTYWCTPRRRRAASGRDRPAVEAGPRLVFTSRICGRWPARALGNGRACGIASHLLPSRIDRWLKRAA